LQTNLLFSYCIVQIFLKRCTSPYTGLSFDGVETSNGILAAGNWYHIAAVNDNGSRHLYLNGVEQSLNGGAQTVLSNSDPLRIGVDYSSRYFHGAIDEVRIWNVVRTEQEIRENMHKTLDNTGSGLAAYWQFNDGNGSTLGNSCGSHSGTLTNIDLNSVWVSSTIPTGGGNSSSANGFTSGTANLNGTQIISTDDFDNPVNLVCTDIDRSPNTTLGISGNVQNSYCVLKAYPASGTGGTPGTFTVNITFTLPEGSISEADQSSPSNLKLYRRESNANGDWALLASASGATSTTVTFEGITSFSQFIIGSETSPLPVELTSFTAASASSASTGSATAVVLNWTTATEVNNYGFEMERKSLGSPSALPGGRQVCPSYNGHSLSTEWEKVGFVEGAGNSNSPKEYTFADNLSNLVRHGGLQSCNFQYRLKQIDNDGKFTYSEEVEIDINFIPGVFILEQNYPNPFNPVTTIKFGLPETGKVSLKVYNIIGEQVAELIKGELNPGYHEVNFGTDNMPSGLYIYRLNVDGKFSSVRKMLMIK
jgi:hypothetical protein